jgi:alanine-synthesizing transaminase
VRIERVHSRFTGSAWELDLDAIERVLPEARGVLVVHPNHPTGTFLGADEAGRLARSCAAHGVPLLVDEVFGEFHDPGAMGSRPPTLLRASFVDERVATTLVLGGLSKTCGLPQLKLGWIVVAGPAGHREDVLSRLEWLADAFLSVGGPVQQALPGLLAMAPAFQAAVLERVGANRRTLEETVRRVPAATLLPSDGGWSAVLSLPGERDDETWALALLEHDVVVHPGYFYDFAEPGRLVLSLLPSPDRFREALARIMEVARD